MVDSDEVTKQDFMKKKNKKRKQRSNEEDREEEEEIQRLPKSSRLSSSGRKNTEQLLEVEKGKLEVNVEERSPWRNLQLILSLQNKNIDLPEKIKLAFDFVKAKTVEEEDDSSRVRETVSLSRVVVFVSNWIQTVLIASAKKVREEKCKAELEDASLCLDYRCWVVFKFCLEESLKLSISLTIQRDFLRIIHFIARNVLSHLNAESFNFEESVLISKGLAFEDIVLSSITLVFSSHGGALDENLDLWTMLIGVVLKLLMEVTRLQFDDSRAGAFILQLSNYLLEPFAMFLRVHPTRKNSFADFIDRLLEPLMHLVDRLHQSSIKNPGLTKKLLKLVKEVLTQGLFHPTHIDGFLSLQSTGKYRTSEDGKSKDGIMAIKSYHRHLFDKLKKIIVGNNILPLAGIGELLHLFVRCVMKQKGGSYIRESSGHLEGMLGGHYSERSYRSDNFVADKQLKISALDAERRKAIFDFFVQVMEYFLFQIETYHQMELEFGNILEDVLCVFRSMNKLLDSFKEENIYLRTEDTSEGACINFLRFTYETITSFSAKINDVLMSSFYSNKEIQKQEMISLMKEIVTAINCLLDIQYEVVGDNLESLWRMVLSFSACSQSWMDIPEYHVLSAEILHLGCHLIDLYKELRQACIGSPIAETFFNCSKVNTSIFAVCKAVRLFVLPLRDSEACNSSIYCSYANSLSSLLCSPKFRSSIRNAIKSIPEGQASGCIRQLTVDISESLEWLNLQSESAPLNDFSKLNCSNSSFLLDLQAQLLGRNLSEVYTLILDSVTVTTGNSNSVGVSVKDLVAYISDGSRALDSLKSDGRCLFFSIISGRTSSGAVGSETVSLSRWLLVFFFRLYLSCRSLYRLVISLVNPDASRKMSESMADTYTAYSGKDWLDGIGQKADGYFSWIMQPSASLLDIIETVSNIYLQDTLICPPLIYLLNSMALQALVDLNRKIKSYEYLLVKNNKFFETKMIDESGVRSHHRSKKKWMKLLLHLEQEAAGLTKFIMGHVLSLVKKHLLNHGSSRNFFVQNPENDNGWDLSVGALNEKSLPSALWLIICQNCDIWCAHAAKKELKKFLKLLIRLSLPCSTCGFNDSGSNCMDRLCHPEYVTMHQISLVLLRDTVLYEQKFVRRHIASSFQQILRMSLPSIFPNLDEVYLDLPPNWPEMIDGLETLSCDFSSDKRAPNKWMKPNSQLVPGLTSDSRNEEELCSTSLKYASCHSLLNLVNWMPKGYLSSKSFSLFATCILNLEWIVVGSLLGWRSMSSLENPHELIRLFLSCRRTLKNLFVVSADEKTDDYHSSLICMLSENPSSMLWLVKSVMAVIQSQHVLLEDIASQVEDLLFSLTDHTSHMFLTVCKYQLKQAIQSSQSGSEGKPAIGEKKHMIESEIQSVIPNHDPWRSILLLAENLREHMQKSLICFKAAYDSGKVGVLTMFQDLKKLSPVISCIQGFLWGLASGLETTGPESWPARIKLVKSEDEPLYKLSVFLDESIHFINYFVHLLLLKDEMSPICQPSGQAQDKSESDHVVGTVESLYEVNLDVNDDSDEELNSGLLGNSSAFPDINSESNIKDCLLKEKFSRQVSDFESLLAKVQMFDPQYLKIPLLQGFLRGQDREAAYFLRHLFFASSAILRLKLQIGCSPLLQTLIAVLIGISQVLLFEFGHKVCEPSPFSFVWLDGVIKFLEELGSWFPLANPLLSRNLYMQLIDLHLLAIGKCIVLRGKRVDMASNESESSNENRPINWSNTSDSTLSYAKDYFDKLKAKLRMSLRVLIQKSSNLHLLTAIQAIERAVVGVQGSCISNYEICTDICNGGSVSLIVAAGIDCLDLILEYVTGRKRLNVLRRHMQSLVASLFNIILHLQGPHIFTRNDSSSKSCFGPDSGSVILVCIEVLTRISGKHALFQIDSCLIVQALHVPAALFQNYLQLQQSEALGQCESQSSSGTGNSHSPMSTNGCFLDQQYSIDLYAACCRLLCTAVKHHKSETQRCAAILKDTVNVLLNCLEMVNTDKFSGRVKFVWETQGGVKGACCLRRVYEELRQQKDSYGRFCVQFLSCYIWVYCGYGPLKAGMRREIDEALRPGVYALIDACSADDLQYLHSVFGEGPCRSTLGMLQNDYKTNFRYEGKV